MTGAEETSPRPASAWLAAQGTAADPATRPRGRLLRKYALLFIALVGVALIVSSALDFWFSYQENKEALVRVQQEKADAAAQRIEEFVGEIERQIGWTTHARWAAGPLDQRRFDYVRLLRQVPAITELSELDGDGKEQLKVSRLAMDAVGSGEDFSFAPAFTQAKAHRTWFGPVYFRKQSEPYMTLAMACAGKNAGVTVAEINLKLIWDVITGLKIGQGGYAYVVDGRGRLIAHPDISLVLRDTDLSKLPQVAAALSAAPAVPGAEPAVSVANSIGGRTVLTAHAVIAPLGWLVFVEVPLSEAFAPLYGQAARSLALLVVGLCVAAIAAFTLARRMTVPIRELQAGAARIGAGELDRRIEIHTGNELEGLATQFNRMAADLQKSYSGLEKKVEERTAELSEALDRQTATAEVLQVINSSPGDLAPVFDAMLDKAMRLCDAAFGALWTYDGECFHAVSVHNTPTALTEFVRQPYLPGPLSPLGRVVQTKKIARITDLATDDMYLSGDRWTAALVELGGARSYLAVPLLKDDTLAGAFTVSRLEVRPFSDQQTALLENFAAQAVIAMENARLLGDLQQRTGDLQESLEYQTATSDVLKVISRSTFDLDAVLETVVATAIRLCRADQAVIYRNEDGEYRWAAGQALSSEYERNERTLSIYPGTGTIVGRAAIEGRTVQILDAWTDPFYEAKQDARIGNVHSMIGVPLMREGLPIGVIGLARKRVEPFTEKQIDLVTTFADQAVIAIESARLFNELRSRTDELTQRQAELRVTFDNMADGVAMFDEELRLAAWNRNFQQILDLPDAFLAEERRFPDYIRYLVERGEFGAVDIDMELRRYAENMHRNYAFERTRPDGRVLEVRHNPVPSGGFVLIYADITERKRSEAEIRAARDAAEAASRTIEAAYQELKAAQARLIQAEKMASLGQLTAGIAHEIKNPLNFVNNFANLSVELLDELKEAAAPALAALDDDRRADIDEIVGMLTGNLEKIAEHGRRADGIVKSMLEHSRGESGERRNIDLNALVDEALNLAYHGARAQDQNFNITLERDFAHAIVPIELVPQDITRVLLNLFGNGFYAATKRQRDGTEPNFRPVLKVTTHDLGDAVEIRIRDNGTGIPAEIKDKLFQPFFTTKPTGEGTGLGLSISYDIVVQQHGGMIEVDSRVGEYTEFAIHLPRTRGATTTIEAAA
jgi:PAS domain S-box-containing protein